MGVVESYSTRLRHLKNLKSEASNFILIRKSSFCLQGQKVSFPDIFLIAVKLEEVKVKRSLCIGLVLLLVSIFLCGVLSRTFKPEFRDIKTTLVSGVIQYNNLIIGVLFTVGLALIGLFLYLKWRETNDGK